MKMIDVVTNSAQITLIRYIIYQCVFVYVCAHGYYTSKRILHTLRSSHIHSQGDFTAIVDLPEGEHEYKFYVDGEWLHNPDEVRHRY